MKSLKCGKIVFTYIVFLLFSNSIVFSQDKVYLKNKQVIEGSIIQVTSKNIEINPNTEKPFLLIPRDSVSVLIYSDNTVISFESEDINNENIDYSNVVSNKFEFECQIEYEIENMKTFGVTKYPLYREYAIKDTVTGQTFSLFIDGFLIANRSVRDNIVWIKECQIDLRIIKNGRTYSQNLSDLNDVSIYRSHKRKAVMRVPFGFDLGDYFVNATVTFENIEEYFSKWSGSKNRCKGDLIITLKITD